MPPVRRVVELLGADEVKVVLRFGPPLADSQRAAAPASDGSSNVLPWITGVSSAVLLIGAGGLGFAAYRDWSDYSTQLDRFTSQSELDRLASQTRSKALVADIVLGAAVASGVATVIILLASDDEAPPPAARKRGPKLSARGLELRF